MNSAVQPVFWSPAASTRDFTSFMFRKTGIQMTIHTNDSHSDRHYVCDRTSIQTISSANAAGRIHKVHIREELSLQEDVDNTMALQSGQGLHNFLLSACKIAQLCIVRRCKRPVKFTGTFTA